MFGDTDLVFFGGWLRGNTEVTWGDEHDLCLNDELLGVTLWLEPGKCRITLNSPLIFGPLRKRTFRLMWSTMLHEMWYVNSKSDTDLFAIY